MSYNNGNVYFPKVKEARERLKAMATELIEKQIRIVDEARIAGDFETASKANQWLIEHLPEDEGTRVIDISVDKPAQIDSGPSGPLVQISFPLGGMNKPLPTIEAVPLIRELPPPEEQE